TWADEGSTHRNLLKIVILVKCKIKKGIPIIIGKFKVPRWQVKRGLTELELKMKREDYLVMLIKDIVKTVVKKVVQNLNMFQRKQQKRGSRLCYVCWRKGHLAYLCPSIKDQSHDQSLNYNVMDVHHVEVGRKKHEGLKR
ncbi:2704_t:CDS:1, partial [Racocetra persica]